MSEQYRCNKCGYILEMKDVMCSECGTGYFEHLRWAKGGDGSHWDGCEDVHWDCRIAQLEAKLARRDEELERERDNYGKLFTALEDIYDALGLDDHTGSCIPEIDKLHAELARRDEELLELNNDKAVFIKFENEDELPAEIKDDVYSAMFECSHVDGVRLFPYIEENGQKYFLVMLKGLE